MNRSLALVLVVLMALVVTILALIPRPRVPNPGTGDTKRPDATSQIGPRTSEPGLASPRRGAVRVPASIVTGFAIDAATLEPVLSARVALGTEAVGVGKNGRFSLPLNHIVGSYRLVASAPGYEGAEVQVRAKDGTNDIGNLLLAGSGRLVCRVVNHDSRPVRGAIVSWTAIDQGTSSNFRTRSEIVGGTASSNFAKSDADGRANLLGVPTQRSILLEVQSPEGAGVFGPYSVGAASESEEVLLVLQQTYKLSVRIDRAETIAQEQAMVSVSSRNRSALTRFHRERLPQSGIADFQVPVGSYQVSLRVNQQVLGSASVDVTDDTTITVTPLDFAMVAVRVEDPAGKPIPQFACRVVLGPEDVPGSPAILLFRPNSPIGRDGMLSTLALPGFGDTPAGRAFAYASAVADGFALGETHSRVDPTGHASLRLVLHPSAAVVGHIRGSMQGSGLSLALLRHTDLHANWSSANAPTVSRATVGPDGEFRLGTCGAGSYEVRMGVGGADVPLTVVDAPETGSISVETEWRPGRIVVSGSAPRPDAAQLEAGGMSIGPFRGVVDGDRIVFENLPPGDYRLGWQDEKAAVGTSDAFAPGSESVHLGVGESREVTTLGAAGVMRPVRVDAPAGWTGTRWIATLLRGDDPPQLAPAVRWIAIPQGGSTPIRMPPSSPCALVVAAVRSETNGLWRDGPVPVSATALGVSDTGDVTVSIPPPGALVIRCDAAKPIGFAVERGEDIPMGWNWEGETVQGVVRLDSVPAGNWIVKWEGLRIEGSERRRAVLERKVKVAPGNEAEVVIVETDGER